MPGQARGDDTQGHCCWPGQAWSTPKARCVGAPTCPHGTTAHGEQCVAPPTEGVPIAMPKLAFALDKKAYKPGATILIRFAHAVPSPEHSRSWITVAAAGAPAASYGEWVYVDDGASTGALKAPDTAGSYEVRLHTDYPTHSTNLAHAEPFTVSAEATLAAPQVTPLAAQRFTAAATARVGAKIDVKFAAPLVAEQGEQFWITIVPRDAADSAYAAYEYAPAAARAMTLAAPDKAGDYEIRLHANYPTKTYNLVHRQTIHVVE